MEWFHEYLNNRVQHVSINGSNSSILLVLSAVPQGSILGPLLFLLFINDLPQYLLHSIPLLFADDTKMPVPLYHLLLTSTLQSDLNKLSNWSSEWKLLFNESKCSLLSFSSNNCSSSNLFPYYINNCKITSRTHHKDLGIAMSYDLSLYKHIAHISSKAYHILGLLRRTFSATNSITTRKSLYIFLVCLQLLYGS